MNYLYTYYFKIPQLNRFGLLGKIIIKIHALLIKRMLDWYLPRYYQNTAHQFTNGLTADKREIPIVVSITSFPARIEDVWISLEIFFRQTVKPDAVILWLASSQFKGIALPKSLLDLQSRGLTIRFVADLRSHKKYYFAMQEFPQALIVTFDDDLYYDSKVIERLVTLYEKYPDCICTNRAHEIIIKNGKVVPYRNWNHNAKNIQQPTRKLLPTGGAGTLYPPNSLPREAFDVALIKSLCFHADDVWLKLMSTLNDKHVVTHSFYNKDFLTIRSSQNEKLVSQNVFDGGNDKQFDSVCHHFSIQASQFTDS